MRRSVVLLTLILAGVLTAVAGGDPLGEGATQLVGVAAPGLFTPLAIPVDSTYASTTSMTTTGNVVAFTSTSDGLVSDDNDAVSNVYVKDRGSDAVELVSRRTNADGAPADADCSGGSISDDGNLVAFTCDGPLLDADTNGKRDVYLRDRSAHTTRLLSRTKFVIGDGDSFDAAISGNGLYVVFTSLASNLAPASGTGAHVILRDLSTPVPELVDRSTASSGTPNGSADSPSISNDGLRIAFISGATNLTTGLSADDAKRDAFWRDYRVATPVTHLASSANGDVNHSLSAATSDAQISGDGNQVVFSTGATDVADGDNDTGDDIHRRTLATSTVMLVNRADGNGGAKPFGSDQGGVSDNGDAVLFHSFQLPGVQALNQVYVRRIGAGTTELVSRAGAAGSVSTDVASPFGVSGDGLTVLFTATGLTPDADPARSGLYARTGTTTSLVGRPPGSAPFVNLGSPAYLAGAGSLSADGRYALFGAEAPGLPGARPGTRELWRRDNLTGAVVLVSRAPGAGGAAADAEVLAGTISADGNRVVFSVTATNLGAGALNSGVYVRDIDAGTTVVASRADGTDGTMGGGYGTISSDGRHVGFVSADAAITGGGLAALVRDLDAGTTKRLPSIAGVTPQTFRLSANGARAAIGSRDPDPTDPTSDPAEFDHIYAADLGGGAPKQLDVGAPAKAEAHDVTISEDGTRVAFTSEAPLVPADTDASRDVYVATVDTGALTLVTPPGSGVDGFPFAPQISGDGARVAFVAAPTDPGPRKAYVRDLAGGTTRLASPGVGTEPVDAVAIDRAGGCVAYQTDDTALATGLPIDVDRVWLHALTGTCPVPAPVGPGTTSPSPSASPSPTVVAKKRPVASKFTAKPKRFKTRGKKRGTRFSWTLNQAASVRIHIARLLKGHRKGKVCRPGKPKRKQRKCTRAVRVATVKLAGRKGANHVRFRKRGLKAGRYRATLTATSAGGTSKPVSVRLRGRRR